VPSLNLQKIKPGGFSLFSGPAVSGNNGFDLRLLKGLCLQTGAGTGQSRRGLGRPPARLGIDCRPGMIEMQTGLPALRMNCFGDFFEFVYTGIQMHTELLGMLSSIGCHRNRFNNNDPGTVVCHLFIEADLFCRDFARGGPVSSLDGGENKTVHRLQALDIDGIKQIFHANTLLPPGEAKMHGLHALEHGRLLDKQGLEAIQAHRTGLNGNAHPV